MFGLSKREGSYSRIRKNTLKETFMKARDNIRSQKPFDPIEINYAKPVEFAQDVQSLLQDLLREEKMKVYEDSLRYIHFQPIKEK